MYRPVLTNQSRILLQRLIVITALSILAFSTRILPYSISPLPYNNDGITEARIADDILSAGHLSYPEDSFYSDTYSVITPIYNVMLAFASSSIGCDTFLVSQSVVAVLSILAVVGGYVLALRIANSLLGALSAAFVLSLLGTFVFLTGSSWKGALGVAMLVLLVFAYVNRSDKRYLAVELLVLACLPMTYHLATVLAYLLLAYLTCWSFIFAFKTKRFGRSHLIDLMIISIASLAAYYYYSESSLQRLADYGSVSGIAIMLVVFSALAIGAAAMMIRKKSLSLSFAPIAGTSVVTIVLIDYYNPVFPYSQGFSSNVVFLALIFGFIVSLGWFGFETLVRSNTRYRAVPLGLLLPVLTLFLFTMLSGFDLEGHKVFYRTFDYADISLALGAGAAVSAISKIKVRTIVVCVLVFVLICSFPFSYGTAGLLGDRHDTQEYEVDAILWVRSSVDSSTQVRSDERLSYNARALCDFGKDPYLPSRLVSGDLSTENVMNLLLEEWMTTGVNDYPRGHPVLDEEYVNLVLAWSNVLYVGGPESNNLIVFQTTAMTSSSVNVPR